MPGVTVKPGGSSLGHWLREPLVIFVVIGTMLFAIDTWRNDPPVEISDRQIVITEDDLIQMAAALQVEDLSSLSPKQFVNLLEVKVREEVLYREALAMGLDVNDTIVKRRMAQKMEFLAEDLADLREPTDEELHDWLRTHPQDFAIPPRVNFQHVYFSFDERGTNAQNAAIEALSVVAGLAMDAPAVAELGDPFMFQDFYSERTPDQIASEFGVTFANTVFELPASKWNGPIESGFGWHLVFVDSLIPSRIPELEEVKDEVKKQWTANQRNEFRAAAYETMRQKYEVILPPGIQVVED